MTRVVVIGVGNPYRRDDGAGIEVARRLAASAPEGVEVAEHDGEPARLLDVWDGAAWAFVVDAVRSGAEPGTVHRLEVDERGVPSQPRRDSSHALGIGDAVDLARALGRLPRRLVLYGIEGTDHTAGVGLSPPVEAAVGALVERIESEAALVTGGGIG